MLKNKKLYSDLGVTLPRGVLLYGPPGVGKTLLARAIAGEVGVPIFHCSGSDFVEVYVGRGAARIRALFDQARKNSPCVIFIDEIDSLAKERGGLYSNEEREQTLNQLLSEIDGFKSPQNASILLIAATNRHHTLDKALLRCFGLLFNISDYLY